MQLFPWLVSLKKSLALAKARNTRRALVRPESLEPRMLLTVAFDNGTSGVYDAAGTTLVIDTTEDVAIGVNEDGFVTVNGSTDLDGDGASDDIPAEFIEELVVDASDAAVRATLGFNAYANGEADAGGIIIDLTGVTHAFGGALVNPDFCPNIKVYGSDVGDRHDSRQRSTPARCTTTTG